jgi:hypothetical protein
MQIAIVKEPRVRRFHSVRLSSVTGELAQRWSAFVWFSNTRIPFSVTRYSCPSHIAITSEEPVEDAELRYRAQIHSELFD